MAVYNNNDEYCAFFKRTWNLAELNQAIQQSMVEKNYDQFYALSEQLRQRALAGSEPARDHFERLYQTVSGDAYNQIALPIGSDPLELSIPEYRFQQYCANLDSPTNISKSSAQPL